MANKPATEHPISKAPTRADVTGAQPAWMTWTGRVLTGFVGLGLFASAMMKLTSPEMLTEWIKMGFPEAALVPVAVAELLCALLLVVPQTSVLGAILVAAYLGGAVATHVRIGDPFIAPVVLGVLAWAGLFLRDSRLRALLPIRRG